MRRTFLILAFPVLASSQTAPVSVTWPLTADPVASSTGPMEGFDQQLANLQVQFASGLQRSSPLGTAGTWPGESSENAARYMEFVAGTSDSSACTITSISLKLWVNSGSNMRANVYYSTNAAFTLPVQIGSTWVLSSTAPSTANIAATPGLELMPGEKIYLRIYPWYTTATTGKYVITQNVMIAGTVSTVGVPTLVIEPPGPIDFGTVVAQASDVRNISLRGFGLIPAADSVILESIHPFLLAPSAQGPFSDRLAIAYSDSVLPATPIWIRFSPESEGSHADTILISGGGASIQRIALTGIGTAPGIGPVYQAEDARLAMAQVESTNGGFTGNGYVNYDNAAGGWIEWLVAFTDAAPETLRVVYANGGATNRRMTVQLNDAAIPDTMECIPTGSWSVWNGESLPVSLVAGVNRIRLTSLTADGGPNVDRIEISGIEGAVHYTLACSSGSGGAITVAPERTSYPNGMSVVLTAVPEAGMKFKSWSGDLTGWANPDSIILNKHRSISATFVDTNFTYTFTPEAAPVGFASVNARGLNGTTGGAGGEVIQITSPSQLRWLLLSRKDASGTKPHPPITLLINGTLTHDLPGDSTMYYIKETKNISIIGVGADAKCIGFGFYIVRSQNIIIRNIEVGDSPDGISITEPETHHIWIDHCTLTDSPANDPNGSNHDGLLDVTHGASHVTISWNHFTNHSKTCLLGHTDDNQAEDTTLTVTYHHNWFDHTVQRNPRVRWATAHVFNNYYDNNSLYGVASTQEAKVVVEGCYFLNVPTSIASGWDASGPGDVVERNNIFVNSGIPQTRGIAFEPSQRYPYMLDDASQVPDIVTAYAGAGVYDYSLLATHAEDTPASLPKTSVLLQNYPNPFNPETVISYQLSVVSDVDLRIYDLLGREMAVLVNERRSAGQHSVTWNGSTGGRPLASGIYYIQLRTNQMISTIKAILLR